MNNAALQMNLCKTCSGCGQAKVLSEFYRNKAARDGLTARCKRCMDARTNAWKRENRSRSREINLISAQKPECKEKARANLKARSGSPEWKKKERARQRRRDRRRIESLSNYYVKRLLADGTGISLAAIPASLIELKREQLSLQRLAKQLKQAIDERTGHEQR